MKKNKCVQCIYPEHLNKKKLSKKQKKIIKNFYRDAYKILPKNVVLRELENGMFEFVFLNKRMLKSL